PCVLSCVSLLAEAILDTSLNMERIRQAAVQERKEAGHGRSRIRFSRATDTFMQNPNIHHSKRMPDHT
ncbi:hypothetical protein Q4595_30465, partial [Wenyingzhuangia sp. 1_MG-2023]|nr:hypothetical protein [Wenyingzhuangia sp. 1_MG-2023]